LGLEALFEAMADDQDFLRESVRRVLLAGVEGDRETILYRQAVLRDCLENRETVWRLYAAATGAIEGQRKNFWSSFRKYAGSALYSAMELMRMFLDFLRELREVADHGSAGFRSEGFGRLFEVIRRELGEDFFEEAEGHLKELALKEGVLMSAQVGRNNKGTAYALHRMPRQEKGWIRRLLPRHERELSFCIGDRDEAGARALGDLKDRAIERVAVAMSLSSDHVFSFFVALRGELAFYVGCLNLRERLERLGSPVTFAVPEDPRTERGFSGRGLYDPCLALRLGKPPVGNDLEGEGKSLILVTGANQGGKSTFLRSLGLAQLMMQSGLFVPAESFRSAPCDGIFTHYRRREDPTMESGKLDEELGRMSRIVDALGERSLILFNESFAATNEREGSEIALQIVRALSERGVRIAFVTHLHEFPCVVREKRLDKVLFLRAERLPDGRRSFRVVPGEPLRTSFGRDLFDRIFPAGE